MLSIYIVTLGGAGHDWRLVKGSFHIDLLRPGSAVDGWSPPELYWPFPAAQVPDVTILGSGLEFDPAANPALAHVLSKTGDLLPLGGEAAGRVAHQMGEYSFLVDRDRTIGNDLPTGKLRPTQQSDVRYWAFDEELLVPNTVVYELAFGWLAIEDESRPCDLSDFDTCGLRSLFKTQGLEGLLFKRIWSSTERVEYDRGWFYKAMKDDSLWD